MPCQTVITCSAFEWNVEARCVRSAGWVGRGRWSECALGTSTISLPAISWALRRILSEKYSIQATRISTRGEHRFIVKWEDPCHKISMTRSQMLKVQSRSDFQSGSSVFKKVFWTFSYIYIYGIHCDSNTQILKIPDSLYKTGSRPQKSPKMPKKLYTQSPFAQFFAYVWHILGATWWFLMSRRFRICIAKGGRESDGQSLPLFQERKNTLDSVPKTWAVTILTLEQNPSSIQNEYKKFSQEDFALK